MKHPSWLTVISFGVTSPGVTVISFVETLSPSNETGNCGRQVSHGSPRNAVSIVILSDGKSVPVIIVNLSDGKTASSDTSMFLQMRRKSELASPLNTRVSSVVTSVCNMSGMLDTDPFFLRQKSYNRRQTPTSILWKCVNSNFSATQDAPL